MSIEIIFAKETIETSVEIGTTAIRPLLSEEDYDDHAGDYQILVRAGRNEWRYYGLTSTQLRFWRGLTKAERTALARAQERRCFICALKRAIETRKRLVDRLYSSMMASLLAAGGRA
jgi:hypothetical protein